MSMRKRLVRIACATALLATAGCLPLTFSHEGNIDFTQWRSVYIQPVVTSGDPLDTGYSTGLQEYLANELRQNSGFRLVTTDLRDTYDTVLVVELFIEETYDSADDGYDWDVDAEWTLRTVDGQGIDNGRVNEDASTRNEASEEAMDAIAYRYLAPYRL